MAQRIDSFGDLALAVDKYRYTSPDSILNEAAQYRNYTFFGAFENKKRIEAGNGIQTTIQLTKDNLAQWVNEEDSVDYQRTYGTQTSNVHWATIRSQLMWMETETQYNGDGGYAGKLKHWFNILDQRKTRMNTDMADVLEGSLWAAPHANMEIAIGSTTTPTVPRQAYSIPSLITPGGLAPSAFGSTVQGLSTSTYANWRNQSETFTDFKADILESMYSIYTKTDWQAAGGPAAKDITGTPKDKLNIYCDFASYKDLGIVLREHNDRMSSLDEYHFGLGFHGKAIRQVEAIGGLDTAEAARRIFFVNWEYLDPVIRRDFFWKPVECPHGGGAWSDPKQPFARFLPYFTSFNLVLLGRKRQGIITHSTVTSV